MSWVVNKHWMLKLVSRLDNFFIISTKRTRAKKRMNVIYPRLTDVQHWKIIHFLFTWYSNHRGWIKMIRYYLITQRETKFAIKWDKALHPLAHLLMSVASAFFFFSLHSASHYLPLINSTGLPCDVFLTPISFPSPRARQTAAGIQTR